DEAAHRVVMSGEGNEQGGAGSAKMTMESTVETAGDGMSRVVVKAKVDLVGRLVQFGRGMIQSVAKQLFKQFATAVREELGHEEPPAAAATSPVVEEAAALVPAEPRRIERATLPSTPAAIEGRPLRKQQPVRALPLVFKALWDLIAGFFRRLFG